MAETQEALKCPQCGHKGEFLVEIQEYITYSYEGGEFTPAVGLGSNPIPDAPYDVTCGKCGHSWEEVAWADP